MESDLGGSRSGRVSGSLGAREIGKVKIHLGLGELNEAIEGANEVPTAVVDLVALDISGELVVLDAVRNRLNGAYREGEDNKEDYKHDC